MATPCVKRLQSPAQQIGGLPGENSSSSCRHHHSHHGHGRMTDPLSRLRRQPQPRRRNALANILEGLNGDTIQWFPICSRRTCRSRDTDYARPNDDATLESSSSSEEQKCQICKLDHHLTSQQCSSKCGCDCCTEPQMSPSENWSETRCSSGDSVGGASVQAGNQAADDEVSTKMEELSV